MKRGMIIILIMLISVIVVDAHEFSAYDEILLNLNISSTINIIPKSEDYKIHDIKVNLFIFPEDNWQQQVMELNTLPKAEKKEKRIFYHWQDIKSQKLNFLVNSNVKIKNQEFPIRNKIKFPITELDPELEQWLLATPKINSDDSRIIRLASSLAEGEDDLFKVVFKIANFTKNHIHYDLKFAGEVKSALWMLNNRNGVCGDFSSLFLALTKALGIPAKYIIGIAYSDNKLVPHAWTEVYFPDIGWIPFDPTYGELGYIDSSHIKLRESMDIDHPSVHYEWSGKDFDVNIKKLQFNGEIIEKIGKSDPVYSLNLKTENKVIDFGSYQLIKAKIKNLKDYYITGQLNLLFPKELELISPKNIAFLLKPKQEKELYWILKISEKLSTGYVYNLPIGVKSIRDISDETSFTALAGAESYTLTAIQNKIQQKTEESEKTYSTNLKLACESNQKEIYVDEKSKINCKINNIGNKYLENLYVCLKTQCQLFNLGIGQSKMLQYELNPAESITGLEIIARNDLITKTEKIRLKILDLPKITISEISYPNKIKFGDLYNLKFKLTRASVSLPQEITIHFNYNKYKLKDFQFQKEIIINNLNSLDLLEGKNKINISIKYKDKRGKEYSINHAAEIELSPLTSWQRIIIKINSLFNQISQVISQAYVEPKYYTQP